MAALTPAPGPRPAKFEVVDAKFERVEGRIDKRIAQHTYVVLVGLAAMITPVYIALFAGFGT